MEEVFPPVAGCNYLKIRINEKYYTLACLLNTGNLLHDWLLMQAGQGGCKRRNEDKTLRILISYSSSGRIQPRGRMRPAPSLQAMPVRKFARRPLAHGQDYSITSIRSPNLDMASHLSLRIRIGFSYRKPICSSGQAYCMAQMRTSPSW